MMIDVAIQAFRKTTLFGHLGDEYLGVIAGMAEEKAFSREDYIFREGDNGDGFYLILQGRVRISRQISGMGEEALTILESGNYFGEMALIDDQPRSADAIAQEKSRLLFLKTQDLQDLLFVDKSIAYEVLWSFVRTLSGRLRETSDKLTFLTVSSKFG